MENTNKYKETYKEFLSKSRELLDIMENLEIDSNDDKTFEKIEAYLALRKLNRALSSLIKS